MNIYAEEAAEIEVYSIDEAFLKYPSSLTSEEVSSIATALRKKVKRWVGIPISLGIGPTKTLSKVANYLAKKNKTFVFDLSAQDVRDEIFRSFPVGEVWGIGSGFREKLNKMGIYTAADFLRSDPAMIRKKMGVVGERMLWELRGVCCLDLEEVSSKKSITCSRSFGQALTEEAQIAEALAAFAAKGCVKLRKQKSCAKALYIFLETTQTNSQGFQRLQFNEQITFSTPTNDTSEIIAAAKKGLKRIYQSHIRYKKCGITFVDLFPEGNVVPDFFLKPKNPKRKVLMQTMDELNRLLGKDTLFFGSLGINPQWKARREHLSFYNTTSWEHLPLVKT
jgi:DNA polymerase V